MRVLVVIAAAVLVVAGALPAEAQLVEISALAGWTLSDGVSGDSVQAGDGNRYNSIDPKDSASWGLGAGFFVGENEEVGFLFGQQKTTLRALGTTTRDIADLTIRSYHPYFAYNFGDGDARVRPYFLIGLGATGYSDLRFTTPDGEERLITGGTRISTTWGGGVKAYASDSVGIRLGVQWTPTFIKSDSSRGGGWWCGPFWGCYAVGRFQYANQFQLSGGVTFRF